MRQKPKPQFDWSEIDNLNASVAAPEDPAPGRSFTVAEYSKRYRVPYQTAAGRLRKLAGAGALKAGMKSEDLSGQTRRVRCYWVPSERGEHVHR